MSSVAEKLDLSVFSNKQLLELKRHQEKIPELIEKIDAEIERRRIDENELQRINTSLDREYGEDEKRFNEPLSSKDKLLVFFLPFFSGRIFRSVLKTGSRRSNREYWRYLTAGYLLYSMLLFAALYFLGKRSLDLF